MAESTLSLEYADFRNVIGYQLGFGRYNASIWTANMVSLVDEIINAGLRKFYFPQPLDKNGIAHKWSFLYPITTLTTIVDYDTGTVSSSGTTVTISGGTWPTWAATNGTLEVDNEDYEISSRTDGNDIELTSAPDSAFSGDDFVLKHDANYEMEDDFGDLNGRIFFPSNQYHPPIYKVPYRVILNHRQNSDDPGTPRLVGLRPKTTDGTDGQRFIAMFWPRPDEEWDLVVPYQVLVYKLTSTYKYPYGGMAHADTILASMQAEAEKRGDDQSSIYREQFIERLAASIALDLNKTPDFHGYNGDHSDGSDEIYDRHFNRNQLVTYEGMSPNDF